jgi:hypothetical protein
LSRKPLADSSEPERRGVEAGYAKEWNADGREARGGMVRTDSGPNVTANNGAGIVTLSIINYMVHCSNGKAFEWGGNR